MKPLSLYQRADCYNRSFPHLNPLHVDQFGTPPRPFITGFWFVGGGNVSEYYGSYQIEYLKRMGTLFEDATKVVHLFSGSLPSSDKYTRVGIDHTGKYKSDLEINVEELSSHLSFKPDLIYCDPPYSEDKAEIYGTCLCNRQKVLSECHNVLQPGGYIVWMDGCLPLFSNKQLALVGVISYVRSTGNRFRCLSLFQKVGK
jgi:hypothetical protein